MPIDSQVPVAASQSAALAQVSSRSSHTAGPSAGVSQRWGCAPSQRKLPARQASHVIWLGGVREAVHSAAEPQVARLSKPVRSSLQMRSVAPLQFFSPSAQAYVRQEFALQAAAFSESLHNAAESQVSQVLSSVRSVLQSCSTFEPAPPQE